MLLSNFLLREISKAFSFITAGNGKIFYKTKFRTFKHNMQIKRNL